MFGSNHVNIKGQHLKKYSCSSGGGMTGGYNSETIRRYDDGHALIYTEKAEWHNDDPEVNEYLVDVSIMDELEEVIRKGHMNFWNHKKFTNMFIADGESEGYSFSFDDAYVSFSSQYYPKKYRDRLRKLDGIIKKYLNDAERLPGLVNPRREEGNHDFPEGELLIYVSAYRNDALEIRIMNGTDDDVELSGTCSLIDVDNNKEISKMEMDSINVSSSCEDSFSVSLKERLASGDYKLVIGETVVSFAIR